MKKILVVISLAALVANLSLQTVLGKDAPATAEQLRSNLESAFLAKDTNAVFSLFNWDGVSGRMKSFQCEVMAKTLEHGVQSVKLLPLPPDYRLSYDRNGVRYSPSVVVLGLVELDVVKKDNSENTPKMTIKIPYGKKGESFLLSCSIEKEIPGPITKSKLINITILGMADRGTFTGSYVVVRSGKEIKETISEKGVGFYGDYIKSCTVQKKADSEDSIQLTISEDGKEIFESEEITNRTPIVYEKK